MRLALPWCAARLTFTALRAVPLPYAPLCAFPALSPLTMSLVLSCSSRTLAPFPPLTLLARGAAFTRGALSA